MALILRYKPPNFCGFCDYKIILEKFHIVNQEIVDPHTFKFFFMDMYKMDNTAKHARSQIHKIQDVLCRFYENINLNMTNI